MAGRHQACARPEVATLCTLGKLRIVILAWGAVAVVGSPWSVCLKKTIERNAAASDSDVVLILQWFLRTYIAYILFQTWSFSKTPFLAGDCFKRQFEAASLSCRRNLRSPSTADPGVNERGNAMKDLCLRRCYGGIKSGIFYLFCPFVWFPVMQTINRVEELSAL